MGLGFNFDVPEHLIGQPFGEREAEVYDALYGDKVYEDEARVYSHNMGGPSKSVIEFGCGTGTFSRQFMAMGHTNVLGCDPNPAMIGRARAKGVPVIQATMDNLAEHTRFSYDAACAPFAVLCYAGASKAGLRKSLVNVRRCLRPGGRFVADVINYATAVCALRKQQTRETRSVTSDGRRFRAYRIDERRFEAWNSLLYTTAKIKIEWDDCSPDELFGSRHVMRTYTPRELASEFEAAGFVNCHTFALGHDISESDVVLPLDWTFYIRAEAPE